MEYYERERITAECLKHLPYPITFYDKLSDGSLWNVYQKHVVQGIPINKKGMRAEASNNKARIAAQEQKRAEEAREERRAEAAAKGEYIDGDWEHNWRVANGFTQPKKKQAQPTYEQITLEEYYASLQPAKPKLLRTQGCFWRLNDAGEYDYVPDSEMVDMIESFGEPVMLDDEEVQEELGAPRLVLERGFKKGRR